MVKEQLDCLGLKLEGIIVFRMLSTAVHPVTHRHISIDLILQQRHCKNLRSLIFGSVYSNVLLNSLFSNVLIFKGFVVQESLEF